MTRIPILEHFICMAPFKFGRRIYGKSVLNFGNPIDKTRPRVTLVRAGIGFIGTKVTTCEGQRVTLTLSIKMGWNLEPHGVSRIS
jgi:hypothetical protein